MKKKTTKKKKKPMRIEDVVKAARAAGATVTCDIEDNRMPRRFPNDSAQIIRLLDESERLNALGNRWLNAPKPNPIASELAFKAGWAYALAAAFLRTPEPTKPQLPCQP